MIYSGVLYATYNLQDALNFCQYKDNKVIAITDSSDNIPIQLQQVSINGGILIPPFNILALEVDNPQMFAQMYYQYLNTNPTIIDFMALIATALLQERNIMIYIPIDEMELQFSGVLFDYMATFLGVGPVIDGHPGLMSNDPAIYIQLVEFLHNSKYINDVVYQRIINIPMMQQGMAALNFNQYREIEELKKNAKYIIQYVGKRE